jgi:hypothetical protein
MTHIKEANPGDCVVLVAVGQRLVLIIVSSSLQRFFMRMMLSSRIKRYTQNRRSWSDA